MPMLETIGHYKLLEAVGASGLGRMYRARDTARGRTVALTIVLPTIAGDPVARQRLVAALEQAARVSHPHLAGVWEWGEEQEQFFIASEYAAGDTLRMVLAGGPMNPRRAVQIAVDMSTALAEASAKGVVHGDLRPEHVVVTPRDQVKILHLGLAEWTSKQPPPGPLVYAAPEQILGDRFDHRGDLFTLGALLFEMLTGRPAFHGATPEATALQVLQATPRSPSTSVATVPPELDGIVSKAMAKSLEGRYQDAATFGVELGTVAAALDNREVRRDQAHRRSRTIRRAALAASLTAIIAATVGAAAWRWPPRASAPAKPVPAATAALAPVLVIAPFEPVGGDQSMAYQANGLGAEVARQLAGTPGVRVLGRSAARNANHAAAAGLARQLGASAALVGTFGSKAGAVRASIMLLRAGTGEPLLNGEFNLGPGGGRALRDEISRAVLARLATVQGAASGDRPARVTTASAWDLYLHGRDAAEHRDRLAAIGFYDQAVTADPELAEAHAALAEAIYLESYYAGADIDEMAMGRARRAADEAVKLDPGYPPAHLAMALTSATLFDTLRELTEAIRLDSSYADAYHQIGDQIIEIDPERAISYYAESLRLDPGLDASYRDIASANEMLGRLEAANGALDTGRATRPDRAWWPQMQARFQLGRGRVDEAMQLLEQERSVDSSPSVWLIGRVSPLALTGRRQAALDSAERLVDRHPWYCEGQAALGGLRLEAGTKIEQAAARKDLAALIKAGTQPASGAEARVCAAAAASALGDVRQAARALTRIASDEASLRRWMRQSIVSSSLAFRRGWYPWSRVTDQEAVQQASRDLDTAIQRLRGTVARTLPTRN